MKKILLIDDSDTYIWNYMESEEVFTAPGLSSENGFHFE